MRGSWSLVVFAALLAGLALACGGGAPRPTLSPSPRPAPRPTVAPTPASQQAQTELLAIVNGTLIDGTGADPVADAYVIVQGDRILEVGSGDPHIPPDAAIIDAQGGTILPGLIDAHVHSTRQLITPGDLRVELDGFLPWLHEGVTTLRDVGTVPLILPSIVQLVDGLAKNNKAPRIVWSGPIITAIGGYPTTVPDYALVAQEVASAEEATQLVHKLADDGARIIKLGLERGYRSDEGWPLLSLEEVKAISEAAHQRGLLVTAHVTSLDEVRLALDGGVDDLAHAPIEPLSDELMEEMLKRDITMATTAVIWGPDAGKAADNVRRYVDAGGTVALATDFGCCGQAPGIVELLQEVEFLLRAGLTPMQAIVAATRGGAIASNLGDELGTIEVGKVADIIVVAGDPLTDVRALAHVQVVIQSGRVAFEAEQLADEEASELRTIFFVQRTTRFEEDGSVRCETLRRVWIQMPRRWRLEPERVVGGAECAANLSISDGVTSWTYNPDAGWAGRGPAFSALDVAPIMSGEFLTTFDVTEPGAEEPSGTAIARFVGTKTLVDRSAYLLEWEPRERVRACSSCSFDAGLLRWWVDTEWLLELRSESYDYDGNLLSTSTIEEVQYNVNGSQELFTFVPPEGTEIQP